MKFIFFITLLLLSGYSFAFELVIIQGISRTNQTFITRTGKKDGINLGERGTFTAQNVSIIAKAISTSRDFTQWEIENDYTDVPFKKGDVVTYYDTTEYLWALAPEKVKRKYIKNQKYDLRESISIHTALTSALAESVSGVDDPNAVRNGISFELFYEKEISDQWSYGLGFRYTTETININSATFETMRFLGLGHIKYNFAPMKSLYNSQFGFSMGAGYGQSQTNTSGLISSGTAKIVPSTKVTLSVPLDNLSQLMLESGIENINVTESFETGGSQTTNMSSLRVGISYKRFISL